MFDFSIIWQRKQTNELKWLWQSTNVKFIFWLVWGFQHPSGLPPLAAGQAHIALYRSPCIYAVYMLYTVCDKDVDFVITHAGSNYWTLSICYGVAVLSGCWCCFHVCEPIALETFNDLLTLTEVVSKRMIEHFAESWRLCSSLRTGTIHHITLNARRMIFL